MEVRKENKLDALRLPDVQKGGVLLAIKQVQENNHYNNRVSRIHLK